MINILHITVHLGGGVGKAISGIAIQGQQDHIHQHRILLLQPPEKDGYVKLCQTHGIRVELLDEKKEPFEWADVIVVSWWNHPAMDRFLMNFPQTFAARVLWSHVNGVYYPMLPYQMAAFFDGILFTSPFSLQNTAWSISQKQEIAARSHLVYGMGQFDPTVIPSKQVYKKEDRFVVGYVGTLNYGKLHPQFVSYCQAACKRLPQIQFVMVGDKDAELERDICKAGLQERFTFTGFVPNVLDYMRSFDVFGYLLNPTHYGTTENVLLEAMACGLPVIVMKQNVEQFIIPDEAGYLVENEQQYVDKVEFLYHHPDHRQKLGQQARRHVITHYDAQKNTNVFHQACQQAIVSRPGYGDLTFMGITPWQWFLSCMAEDDRAQFEQAWKYICSQDVMEQQIGKETIKSCPRIFREATKGSVRHFAVEYPNDMILQTIRTIIEQE